MARGKQLPDATRAAIIAALLAGQSVTQVATEFKINKSVVSRLRATRPPLELQQVATQKEESLERLVLEYVSTNLRTLKTQSEVVGRPEYIEAQPASEIAVLHGVIADKTFRILSAMESTPAGSNPEPNIG